MREYVFGADILRDACKALGIDPDALPVSAVTIRFETDGVVKAYIEEFVERRSCLGVLALIEAMRNPPSPPALSAAVLSPDDLREAQGMIREQARAMSPGPVGPADSMADIDRGGVPYACRAEARDADRFARLSRLLQDRRGPEPRPMTTVSIGMKLGLDLGESIGLMDEASRRGLAVRYATGWVAP